MPGSRYTSVHDNSKKRTDCKLCIGLVTGDYSSYTACLRLLP
jgi:hypothetical protein